MRLKQLLGMMSLLLVVTTTAAAAGSQLTDVNATTQGGATVITLQTTGTFTHNEYRPADNLLLVDLTGVSAAKLDGKGESLSLPGVSSYRVVGYKGASGTEVARVELTLAPKTSVEVSEKGSALTVRLNGGTATTATAKPEVRPAPAKPQVTAENVTTAKPVVVKDIAMVRGKDGMALEILGSAPMSAKTMTLAGPDRLVIDLENAVPASKNGKSLAVNTPDVKSVRMARFQMDPPVTRIVLDLREAREFEVAASGNKLTVKPREAQIAKSDTPKTEARQEPAEVAKSEPAPAPVPVETAAVATKAQDFAVVMPTYAEKQADSKITPTARATDAATKFAANNSDDPVTAAMAVNSSAAMTPAPAANLALEQQLQMAQQGAATTGQQNRPRYTGEPVSLNLKDADLKDFFRLIHEISGLNVVLDPAVRGTVTIVLDDVPWDQALDIVLRNNNLERELEGNVLRIATQATLRAEAEARRAQQEARALAVDKVTVTRFLSYAHSKDIVATIKRFLTARGEVISDDRTNALIISDIPSVIPNVDRLLRELDRKTQEVEIEARVVAATRNFARDIGTQFGFGLGDDHKTGGGLAAAGDAPTEVGRSPFYIINNNGQIPLFSNLPAVGATSGLSFVTATNRYRLDFYLSMAESRGLLKILSRPRIVTQNNIQALVQQGVRVPVVTSAQLGGPPTVTYVNAFLRLTVTPQITVENTIFLNVDVENTAPDFGRAVNGNPTLITQQATTQVLVSDGGTVVIGGVIQTQNSVNMQQVPFLGDIPLLGNLFKRRAVSTETQELIFFITPRIIQT